MIRVRRYPKARARRHARVRARVFGTKTKPRFSVFRSGKHILAQLIDDEKGVTLVAVSDLKLKGTKSERARQVGEALAKAALKKKIKRAVFDRGGYLYHGRVQALAEGARQGGLEF